MQLMQIQDINQQLNLKRRTEGTEACSKAYDLLAQAIEAGFADRNDFQQAIAAFAKAIRYMRGEPEPYLGMGYALMLMRDYPRAERYLMQVIRLVPNHADAMALLNALPARKAAAVAPVPSLSLATQKLSKPDSSLDPDQLHDNLQKQIMGQVRVVMHLPPPKLTQHPEKLKAMQKQEAELREMLLEWNQNLDELERDLDVNELRKYLKPLETARHRMEKSCRLSQQGLDLKAEIEKRLAGVPPLFSLVAKATVLADLDGMNARIEAMQDDCDALADQLDLLEQEGLPLDEMLPTYEKMIFLIEQLAEEVDDKTTELTAA